MCSNTEGSSVVSVPGKALLFGEFGVMRGGPAVAVCLPQFRMDVEFSFEATQSQAMHSFESRFFSSVIQVYQSQITKLLSDKRESEERNLACYLSSFEKQISRFSVNAKVIESFSPALGFGTSSALLVAFSVALERRLRMLPAGEKFIEPDFWQRLYDALLRLQGRGSGYDIALQAWFIENLPRQSKVVPLSFKNSFLPSSQSSPRFDPLIEQLKIPDSELSRMGCFVETGVHSNTREVLKQMEGRSALIPFAEKHSEIALKFIKKPTFQHAVDLCAEASELIRGMELLPLSPSLQKFVEECDHAGVSWKTMGAGHGDCLWVLADRLTVATLAHRAAAHQIRVRFAFEDC